MSTAPAVAANRPHRKLKIGITASSAQYSNHTSLWENGMAQNILYLAMLFMRLPDVEAWLVVPDDAQGDLAMANQFGLPAFRVGDGLDRLDLLIELGARFDAGQMARFRERGGRLISYVAGNAMVFNFESLANANTNGEILSHSGYDAVWLTPQHVTTNHSYARLTRSDAVLEAPHIWHPACLLNSIVQYGNADFYWKARESEGDWRIGVFDPTINVVKTFHLPLLVCEEAARRAPDLIRSVLLFSAERFIGNIHFSELVASLDLGKAGKVFAEARFPIGGLLGRHVDAVVTHQWENRLNYLYWDVLYSGRPLVHNIADLEGAGYYFRDFDPQDGGRVLAETLPGHGARRDAARHGELEILFRYSIDNPEVQSRYRDLIVAAMDTQS